MNQFLLFFTLLGVQGVVAHLDALLLRGGGERGVVVELDSVGLHLLGSGGGGFSGGFHGGRGGKGARRSGLLGGGGLVVKFVVDNLDGLFGRLRRLHGGRGGEGARGGGFLGRRRGAQNLNIGSDTLVLLGQLTSVRCIGFLRSGLTLLYDSFFDEGLCLATRGEFNFLANHRGATARTFRCCGHDLLYKSILFSKASVDTNLSFCFCSIRFMSFSMLRIKTDVFAISSSRACFSYVTISSYSVFNLCNTNLIRFSNIRCILRFL